MAEAFDVLIVGGGQAGVPLAHALAKAGPRVALAERERLGGSCVNFGCTPSKAALASARIAHDARRAGEFGVRVSGVTVDFPAVLGRARAIAEDTRRGLAKGFEGSANPLLLRGHARFTGRRDGRFLARVGDREVTAREVVLDTGTRARVLSIPGMDQIAPLHSGNWIDGDALPGRLIVLGGGVIAAEMSQFYARMGSRVTMIARSPQLVPREDPEVASALQQALESEGVTVRLNATIERVTRTGDGLRASVSGQGPESEIEGTDLFLAIGRRPNTDDLGLEAIQLEVPRDGYLKVDERLATSVPGVWAAGDIRGGPMFTHTSWDDHRVLLSQMAGDRSWTTRRIVPYAIFTDPELGRVGMTEAEARKANVAHEVLHYPMKNNGRAREAGEAQGFIKVLVEPNTHRILGAAALGASAGELIHIYVDLMNADAPATVLRDAIHIHPTLAEAYQSAVKNVKGRGPRGGAVLDAARAS